MAPTVIAFAPGRVELLGNHTDYNDGVALAAAIDLGVTIRAEKLDADLVEINSEANGREVRVSLKGVRRLDEERWANYYIHVIDLAQAHSLARGALKNGSRYYNLGNGEGFSVKQVIDTAREITGKAIPTEVGPRRAGDPAVLVAASDRTRNELGWIPKFPHVREIVESAWRWHQSNPAGYLK